MKEALKERGLYRDIAKDGAEAAQRALEGRDDPLMKLHWMIANRALEWLGLALMTNKEDGSERCPCCEVSSTCAGKCGTPNCGDDMIVGASNALTSLLAEAKA